MKTKNSIIFLVLLTVFFACQKEYFEEAKKINQRVMGFNGGSIEFKAYAGENQVIATLHFKEGSITEGRTIIPNLYYFHDEVLLNDISNIYLLDAIDSIEDLDDLDSLNISDSLISIIQPNGNPQLVEDLIKGKDKMEEETQWYGGNGRTFIYFVPIDHETGYSTSALRDLRVSYYVDFIHPVTMEFTLWLDQRNITNSDYRPYKIEIPRRCDEKRKECEWEDSEISLAWSEEGYITGYNYIDLTYLVNGKWRSDTEYGLGAVTLNHWQEVNNFELEQAIDSVAVDNSEELTLEQILTRIESGEINFEDMVFDDATIQAVEDLVSIEDVPAEFRYVDGFKYYYKHKVSVQINNFDYMYCFGKNF